MEIIKIKGCKRCGGDLFLERDCEGTEITCLQCGAVYLNRQIPLQKKPAPKRIYAR